MKTNKSTRVNRDTLIGDKLIARDPERHADLEVVQMARPDKMASVVNVGATDAKPRSVKWTELNKTHLTVEGAKAEAAKAEAKAARKAARTAKPKAKAAAKPKAPAKPKAEDNGKAMCRAGLHELTPDNLILWSAGKRCRTCYEAGRANQRARREAAKAKATKPARKRSTKRARAKAAA